MSAKHSNGNGRGVTAVTYVRMSSDKQDASPQQQRDELTKLAERGGYHVVTEYTDEAISGDRTDRRRGFQRMIADATAGKFKAILCWDQDRFGRFDSVEAGYWIHPLRQAGVKLVTVAQGEVDWNTFAGRLIYNVQQEGKHAYLRDLSRNMLRGRIAAAKRGEWLAPAPIGYRIENKRLVLGDPKDIATVKRIYAEYLGGRSLRAIAVGLNTDGSKTPRGNLWNGTSVRKTLTNPAYVGRYVWGDEQVGKYHCVQNGEISPAVPRSRGGDAFVIENNHPAIIEAITFDQAQRRLVKRRTATTPHQDGGGFVFTGLCRCGKCNNPMYGATDSGVVRYRCHNASERGVCDLNATNQAELLDYVLTAIEKQFSDPMKLERMRAILTSQARRKTAPVAVEDLRRQLAKLDTQLAKARRNMALADGDDLRREYESVVRELRSERERLDAAVKAAQKPPGRAADEVEQRVDRAIKSLQRLRATTLKAPVPKQRELLALVIEKVEVWSRQPGGRGTKYQLERGKVHLRPDFWMTDAEADNLLRSAGRKR